MKLQLVPGGKDCLLHAMEGADPPVFSSIKYGNGSDAGSGATEMSNVILNIAITEITRAEGSEFVRLTGTFSNASISERFRVTETGVFIQDPDDHTKEILFAYAHVDETEAILIPSVTDYTFETTDSVLVYVGETENVTAIISESMTTATKAELNAHINDKTNPHDVTAEQIGLGNVPNVSTDGQTPTVDDLDETLTEQTLDDIELQNGDTLSRIVSKVANAIHWLISHIRNKNNPHGVTRAQIGAAAATHTHSASSITSGTLPVSRGGTGVNSTAGLAALVAEGVTSLTTSGTYTGNGQYGSSNKVTISYSKKPKLIIVQPTVTSNACYGGFICLADVTTIACGGISNDVNNSRSILNLSWGSTSVSWYNSTSASDQLNASQVIYRYLIVY